jgi:hypothetical protein
MSAMAPERLIANATTQTPRANTKQMAAFQIFDRMFESEDDIRSLVRDLLSAIREVAIPKVKTKTNPAGYFNFTYSAFACFRIGMSGSASFHNAKKSR